MLREEQDSKNSNNTLLNKYFVFNFIAFLRKIIFLIKMVLCRFRTENETHNCAAPLSAKQHRLTIQRLRFEKNSLLLFTEVTFLCENCLIRLTVESDANVVSSIIQLNLEQVHLSKDSHLFAD